jgi:spermidine synthase
VTALLLLFAGSGCAALIYEVVWFQLLQLVIGSSAISLAVLLSVYMGGLCLGSLALQRMEAARPVRHHPIQVYAFLEFGIGVLGILVLFAIPIVGRMYIAGATQGVIGVFLRGVVSALCLLPPTVLMGATLPALSRWLETTKTGTARIGLLYGANIAGAVGGCLVAGFFLLRVYDLAVATYVAVAINAVVAAIALVLAKRTAYVAPGWGSKSKQQRVPKSTVIYVAIGISGVCALGAQVVWTRLLSLLLGVTVYTFSIILAVFLVGLGAGAWIGSVASRKMENPRQALGTCQFLLAIAVAWTAFMMAASLPYWPIDPWLSVNPWFNFQIDLLRTFPVVFPATVLWGASFPLALAALAAPQQDPAQLSGETYAANTAGAILGALTFSMVFIPWFGTQHSQQLLIGLSALAGLILIKRWRWIAPSTLIAGLLVWSVPDIPWRMIAYGHRIAPTLRAVQLYPTSATHLLYKGEGVNSSIAIAESDMGQRSYHVSGKTEATTALEDMRLQRMLGHIPALLHENPKSILSWGFGAGVTAGSFVVHPGIEYMTICELEPLVLAASTQFFGRQNYNVMNDPRTRIVVDDARHYLLTTKDKFDIITSDPLDPWAKGTAALYTKEFFEAIKHHLNTSGIFAQFVQLYETNEEAVKSELATFSEVFTDVSFWSNNVNGQGYDLVLIGRLNSAALNVDRIQERLDRPDHQQVLESIGEVGFHSAVELLATYLGRPSDLGTWLEDAQINRDTNLRLQYLGGMGLNAGTHEIIFREILKRRRFPSELFIGDNARVQALKTIVMSRR